MRNRAGWIIVGAEVLVLVAIFLVFEYTGNGFAPEININSARPIGPQEFTNRIEIFSEINGFEASRIIKHIEDIEVDSTFDEVQIFINSPGGGAKASFAICEAIKNCTKPVATIALDKAASGAALILSSGTKGNRYAIERSEIMLHRPARPVMGIFKSEEFDRMAEGLRESERIIYDIIAENTGKSAEEIEQDLQEEKRFNTQEAIEYGLIDGVWHEGVEE